MSAEALARVLCSADGLDPDARERGAGPLWEHYQAQAARILADPGPLLAALAEAGVLRDERAIMGVPGSPDKPVRRYATEWTEWTEAAADQAERDSLPCPSCGGDRLRADFTGSGKCHVPTTTEPQETK